MPEAEAFCLLVRLMKGYRLRQLFLPEMPGSHLHLYQYDRLIEEHLPAVHVHLARQGVRSNMYASQWFLTLFAYKFPMNLVVRILDIVIAEGLESILRFGVAVMKKNAETLLELEFEKCLDFLQTGLFDIYKVSKLAFCANR
jgi:ecotropic viral integration site 5 protein